MILQNMMSGILLILGLGTRMSVFCLYWALECQIPIPKAPCSFIVDTWALKALPYHDFGVYVYTITLHGAFWHVYLVCRARNG